MGEVSVDVNKEDQDRINRFSCKTIEMHELEVEMTKKKEEIESLEDAVSALYESEDETAPMMVGESVVHFPRMDVIEKIESLTEKAEGELSEFKDRVEKIKTELAELQVILYSKFKNSINLEE